MANFIKPIKISPTDIVRDYDGRVIQEVEHYAQGDLKYDISHNFAKDGHEVMPEELTDEDKDAAMRRFGVEV